MIRFFIKGLIRDRQRSLLDMNWETDADLATDMVDYLRGDSDNEQDNGVRAPADSPPAALQ